MRCAVWEIKRERIFYQPLPKERKEMNCIMDIDILNFSKLQFGGDIGGLEKPLLINLGFRI